MLNRRIAAAMLAGMMIATGVSMTGCGRQETSADKSSEDMKNLLGELIFFCDGDIM